MIGRSYFEGLMEGEAIEAKDRGVYQEVELMLCSQRMNVRSDKNLVQIFSCRGTIVWIYLRVSFLRVDFGS